MRSVLNVLLGVICSIAVGYYTGQQVFAYDGTGERIIYVISPFGTAEYNDKGIIELEGKAVRFTTFETRLTGFSDLEKIYSDAQSLLPLRVERFVAFPIGAEYLVEEYAPDENALVINKFVGKKKVKEYRYKAQGPMYNAIMLPFYLRTVPDLALGWSFRARLPVQFTVTLSSMDEVIVPAGTFQAYHFTSVPAKFEIWISADQYRIPLKIKGLGGYRYTLFLKKYYPAKKNTPPAVPA
ncbi:MAG: DUF3108 domain-containing protein [Candidatus Omnitrophica bacterium]|nr:DUF3108 domain-containing protein [Candidatus Omnitrophota bacterium]